uniref:hypothetical protein n=1 Tax=Escherichia coli TaxID=562 RepID=UPI00131F050B|nr:hypothetical protein [Escherichia coli]
MPSANTSPHRVCGGLSPLSRSSATTVEEQRQSRRYAPCPAHIPEAVMAGSPPLNVSV